MDGYQEYKIGQWLEAKRDYITFRKYSRFAVTYVSPAGGYVILDSKYPITVDDARENFRITWLAKQVADLDNWD